nr:MAG TPA: hypothetical protein [Caudoviricetes sp.]
MNFCSRTLKPPAILSTSLLPFTSWNFLYLDPQTKEGERCRGTTPGRVPFALYSDKLLERRPRFPSALPFPAGGRCIVLLFFLVVSLNLASVYKPLAASSGRLFNDGLLCIIYNVRGLLFGGYFFLRKPPMIFLYSLLHSGQRSRLRPWSSVTSSQSLVIRSRTLFMVLHISVGANMVLPHLSQVYSTPSLVIFIFPFFPFQAGVLRVGKIRPVFR